MRQEKKQRGWGSCGITLTTATGNGTASSAVGVSLCTWLTVIVGCTPERAWHGVPLQSSVAYVLRGCQYAPVYLGVHIKLIVSYALSHGALAASLGRNPVDQVVVTTCFDGRQGDDQSCED